MTAVVMTSAGPMSDTTMLVLILAIAAVAFIPFLLTAAGVAMWVAKTVFKWTGVGILVYVGWKMGGPVLKLVRRVCGDKAERMIAAMEK